MNTHNQQAKETFEKPPRQGPRWILAGFGLGSLGASAYLLLGGEYIFKITLWARLAFLPGFFAGYKLHDVGLSITLSQVVGVLAVASAYAVLGGLAWIVWYALRKHRQTATPREDDDGWHSLEGPSARG